MAVLMLLYAVCATRTNIVYVILFTSLIVVFSLLAAAYWHLGKGDLAGGQRLTVVRLFITLLAGGMDILTRQFQGGGAALFFATMLGFYLLTAQLLDSVAFPLSLPIGDLSGVWNRVMNSYVFFLIEQLVAWDAVHVHVIWLTIGFAVGNALKISSLAPMGTRNRLMYSQL